MNYTLNPQGWMVTLFVLFAVALIIYLCIKDEKKYQKGLKKRPELDETSSRVRYEMSDRLYNEMLMRELRNDAVKAKTLKGKVVEFKVSDGPDLINNDEVIFMQ